MGISGSLLLNRYRVVKPFARGASSVVHLAVDDLGLPYAVKLYPASLAARANCEYLVGHGLEHPHLNPILERISIEGQPGTLSPFVRGVRFSDWVLQHRQELPTVFFQLFDALCYLYMRGFVHRDLKPDNLMVTENAGRFDIKLLDFDLSGRSGEVFADGIPGTPAFLSPEAVMGQALTAAADVYGAGVLLYWSLTGQLPFEGTLKEIFKAHASAPVLHPSQLRASAEPHVLDELCMLLLEKNPATRMSVIDAKVWLEAHAQVSYLKNPTITR